MPTNNQEIEKEKPLDRFYKLYREGRIKEKAPISYIDFFKARKFLLDEITLASNRAVEKERESIKDMILKIREGYSPAKSHEDQCALEVTDTLLFSFNKLTNK